MRLGRFIYEGSEGIGAVVGDELTDLTPIIGDRSFNQLIEDWAELRPEIERTLEVEKRRLPLIQAKLKAPLDKPGKFLLLAANYAEHIVEAGLPLPSGNIEPQFFLKPTTTLIGPDEPIVITPRNVAVDWEGELAVIIGRRGKNIKREEALQYVFGYTVVNDITERRMNANLVGREKRFGDEFIDWLTGKWFDTSAPIGPVITTADEIPDPSQLTIITRLNGEEVQHGGTSGMLFDIPKLISYISEIVTLEPGDVISTGTPAGVGLAKGRFLQPGEIIECQIEGIGTLSNPVTGSY